MLRLAVAAVTMTLMALPASAGGDAAQGQIVFGRCVNCHALAAGDNTNGPSLHGFFGRHAGSMPGYKFSKALIGSGIVWDEASLRRYLADPDAAVPGTKMLSGAVPDPKQQDDLIAYLKSAAK